MVATDTLQGFKSKSKPPIRLQGTHGLPNIRRESLAPMIKGSIKEAMAARQRHRIKRCYKPHNISGSGLNLRNALEQKSVINLTLHIRMRNCLRTF